MLLTAACLHICRLFLFDWNLLNFLSLFFSFRVIDFGYFIALSQSFCCLLHMIIWYLTPHYVIQHCTTLHSISNRRIEEKLKKNKIHLFCRVRRPAAAFKLLLSVNFINLLYALSSCCACIHWNFGFDLVLQFEKFHFLLGVIWTG